MSPEPKVKHRLVRTYDLLDLKVYIFDAGRYNRGLQQLDDVVLDNGNMFRSIGDLGLASVYGYKAKKGFVDGTTIHIFRGEQHKDYDPENPMMHPFCFENGVRILDLGKEGGFCREEGIIFGDELKLHRKLNDRDKYLETWAYDIEV